LEQNISFSAYIHIAFSSLFLHIPEFGCNYSKPGTQDCFLMLWQLYD
jgi:hypothetical protein